MNFAQTGPGNRVEDILSLYAIQEAQAIASNPSGWKRDMAEIALKQHFYQGILATAYAATTKAERQALSYVRQQARRMNARLRPTLWRKIVYNPISIYIRNAVLGRQREFKKIENNLQQSLQGELRTLNVHAVQQTLSEAGFRLPMESALKKMMDHKVPHFHLRYNDPTRCKNTDFVLHFERMPNSDYYQFRSFEAIALPGKGNPQQDQHQTPVRRVFDLASPEHKFSAEEAAILMNDGYVCRTENGNDRWIGLDKTTILPTNELRLTSVAFDLDKAARRLPFADESPSQIDKIKADLRAGKSRTVDMLVKGERTRCKISPNPTNRQIDVWNMAGKKINLRASAMKADRAGKAAAETLRVVESPELKAKRTQQQRKPK